METRKILRYLLKLFGVSNPLGWDGDTASTPENVHAREVSNPLGWDGDFDTIHVRTGLPKVSNPLGWDGDADKYLLWTPEIMFLIH